MDISLNNMLAAQVARWEAMTSDEREEETFAWWDRHPDECERLRYTSKNLILDLVLDRTRRRHSALAERDALDAAHRRIVFNLKSTDAELDEADSAHEAALAAWHARYDHLWPDDELEVTKQKIESDQAEWNRAVTAPTKNVQPVPPEGMESATVLERFWWHMPSGKVLEETSKSFYAAQSVDKHIGRIKSHYMVQKGGPASSWLAQNRYVDCVAWDPNKPLIVKDHIFQDEWIPARGQNTFNLYLPPSIVPVEGDITLWLNHLRFIYPAEWEHVVMWFAHRVQRPGEKCNHALVFVGDPGIGKDIAVQPVIAAIGARNFKSVSAKEFFNSDFNAYLESTMLRIDEVHDLGGESKYAFEDRTKTVIASPPAHHFINAKYIPHHSCVNVTGVILTSNHVDALYIDSLDRRHFVCISERKQSDFPAGYFEAFGSWIESGGNQAVAYYLRNLDISSFHPKAKPPETDGWRRIVAAGMAPETGDIADIIEALERPAVLTLLEIREKTVFNTPQRAMLDDPANRRKLPRRLAECGYVVANNREAKDGRWRTAAGRIQIYARKELSEAERIAAAAAHAAAIKAPEAPRPPPPR